MANSVMMFEVLGYPEDHPLRAIARKLGREAAGRARARGLLPALRLADLGYRAGLPRAARSRRRARDRRRSSAASTGWCRSRCSTCAATGSRARPDLRPGGWAFQYANPHYPDVDDTAVVAMAMDRIAEPVRPQGFRPRASRARANGSSACRARTAPGARSMPTTSIIISTTFRSPITARCSIRRPRT